MLLGGKATKMLFLGEKMAARVFFDKDDASNAHIISYL